MLLLIKIYKRYKKKQFFDNVIDYQKPCKLSFIENKIFWSCHLCTSNICNEKNKNRSIKRSNFSNLIFLN